MDDKVFVDANVLLEIVHERKNHKEATQFVRKNADDLYISALTGHLVMYFGVKVASIEALRELLSDYRILSVDDSDFEWAYANRRNNDFEDALQVAVAIKNGCKQFVTFDKELHDTYRQLPQLNVELLRF